MAMNAVVARLLLRGREIFGLHHWQRDWERLALAIANVRFERPFEGEAQTRKRIAAVGARRVATAVAPVDRLVGIHEKREPRQVVVEFKEVKVRPRDAQQ